MRGGPEVLSRRALNRALLARQGLLTRTAGSAAGVMERLAGMQAQVPANPYVALWARVEDFDPAELSDLVAGRRAVRAQLMRGTIHLVTRRDCLAMQAVTGPVLARIFGGAFGRAVAGVDVSRVVELGRELLERRPMSRAELARALGPRFPQAGAAALAQAVTFNLPLVQVPPRGLWGRSGQPRWALTEQWLEAPLDREATADALVLRYLAAFGPASVGDMRTWSTLAGLRAVVARLRPRLREFRDEQGRTLLDVPDGALPDPATPAPVRLLPEYDNLWLSHADRARVLGDDHPGSPFPTGRWVGTVLVDGFARAYWAAAEHGGTATLTVDRFVARRSDPRGTRDEIAAEGHALLALIAPGAARRRVAGLRP